MCRAVFRCLHLGSRQQHIGNLAELSLPYGAAPYQFQTLTIFGMTMMIVHAASACAMHATCLTCACRLVFRRLWAADIDCDLLALSFARLSLPTLGANIATRPSLATLKDTYAWQWCTQIQHEHPMPSLLQLCARSFVARLHMSHIMTHAASLHVCVQGYLQEPSGGQQTWTATRWTRALQS